MDICHNLSRQLACALIFIFMAKNDMCIMCPDHCNQYCANALVWQTYLAIWLHPLPCSVILKSDLSPIFPICHAINLIRDTELMVGRRMTRTLGLCY